MVILILSACNLAEEAIQVTIAIQLENDFAQQATLTPWPTSTSRPQATQTPKPVTYIANCTPRRDWPTYTVQRGDTLYSIARRANSTLDVLVTANCLADANNIHTGQVLVVPNAISSIGNVVYWIQTETRTSDSLLVACETLISPKASSVQLTNDPATNIRNSLNLLFSSGTSFNNQWSGQGLNVQSVTVNNNGRAAIAISGNLMLVGTCADGVMKAQFLLSVFAESQVQSTYVTIGGRNLVQIFDMSGLKPADAVFTRADIPIVP
jgi:LysM repeat protein